MFYPSDIIDQPFGLSPDPALPEWSGPQTNCSHCARPITEGEKFSPSKVGEFFSDTRDLACTSRTICWRCVILRKKTMLNGLGAAVITLDGVYPISKDIHKAWLFTDPPPAPFLVTHSSATMQHLAWRTPVTLDNRRISVRYGPHLYVVRPEAINKALAIADQMNAGSDKWVSPLYLDRKAADANHGMLIAKHAEKLTAADRETLLTLTPGEKWALAYLMHSKRPVAAKPEPITQTILQKL
jgi:CRISPR type IV-associated protein Csf1